MLGGLQGQWQIVVTMSAAFAAGNGSCEVHSEGHLECNVAGRLLAGCQGIDASCLRACCGGTEGMPVCSLLLRHGRYKSTKATQGALRSEAL